MHRIPSKTDINVGGDNTTTSNTTSAHEDTNNSKSSRRSSSMSAAQRLSALEEKGIKLARLRSIRILAAVALLIICTLIVTDAGSAATSLYHAYETAPSIHTPTGIIALANNVTKASESNRAGAVSLLFSLYLLLQTFCIPGTIALNAVLGALLGTAVGVPACVAAGTVGACCCYTLSSAIGTSFATWLDNKLMKGKGIQQLRHQVNKFRSDLMSYLLFLRLTPVLPNWLINLASPILGIPLNKFALATFLGIAPQTYLSVRFGSMAKSLSDSYKNNEETKIVTIWDTLIIALIGGLVLFVNRLKSKFGGK